jgi:hypothetical protein
VRKNNFSLILNTTTNHIVTRPLFIDHRRRSEIIESMCSSINHGIHTNLMGCEAYPRFASSIFFASIFRFAVTEKINHILPTSCAFFMDLSVTYLNIVRGIKNQRPRQPVPSTLLALIKCARRTNLDKQTIPLIVALYSCAFVRSSCFCIAYHILSTAYESLREDFMFHPDTSRETSILQVLTNPMHRNALHPVYIEFSICRPISHLYSNCYVGCQSSGKNDLRKLATKRPAPFFLILKGSISEPLSPTTGGLSAMTTMS